MQRFTTSDGVSIAYDSVGSGPAVLCLHGFPQTRALWQEVAKGMSRDFTIIMPDLRGYGASSKPEGTEKYTFRRMANDMAELMQSLAHTTYGVVGHDRGGRVAYRLALDHAIRVRRLALLDIIPTDRLVESFDFPASKAYFHWSFLAQPAPLPERMIAADPDLFFEACLLGWGGAKTEEFRHLDAYRAAWRDADTIRGMVEDYRAAVTLDLEDDAADAGRVFEAPTLVLYGESGVMARLYDVPSEWAGRLSDMASDAVPGGHFFVDQSPEATETRLVEFFRPMLK